MMDRFVMRPLNGFYAFSLSPIATFGSIPLQILTAGTGMEGDKRAFAHVFLAAILQAGLLRNYWNQWRFEERAQDAQLYFYG